MKNEDKIRDIFADKLGNLESPVNPALWNAISSQIGSSTAAAGSGGVSLLGKSLIGIGAAAIVGVSSFLYLNSSDSSKAVSKNDNLNYVDKAAEINDASDEESALSVVNEPTSTYQVPSITTHSSSSQLVQKSIVVDKEVLSSSSDFSISSDIATGAKSNINLVENVIAPVAVANSAKTGSFPTETDVTKNQGGNNAQVDKMSSTNVKSSDDSGRERSSDATFEITNLPNITVFQGGNVFHLDYKGEYKEFQVTILDAMNTVVYSSNRADFRWNGLDMFGNYVQAGQYFYMITVIDLNGQAINKISPLEVKY